MKKNNKKNSKKTIYLLLLLILGISVGYAALSATLKINGTSIIKSAKWSVHFGDEEGDIAVTNGSVSGANVITPAGIKANTNKTEIEFSVNLPEPGDFYEFTAQVVNDGSLDAIIANGDTNPLSITATYHDAENDVDVTVPDTTYNKYFTYSIEWADMETLPAGRESRQPMTGDTLAKPASGQTRNTRPVKVRVYYDKEKVNSDADLPKNDVTFNIVFSMNFVQDK